MSDLSQMSDDELMQISGLADISDEQLKQIAGIKTKPENTESLFQRAIKSAGAAAQAGLQNMTPLGVQVNSKFPFLPTMPIDSPALSAGMEEADRRHQLPDQTCCREQGEAHRNRQTRRDE